jgi:acyl-CoA synthetase (AMP-forming)/AMP-acid ligase II
MEATEKDHVFLTDRLDALITSKPNVIAFRFLNEAAEGGTTLTYKELGRKAKALAFLLKEKTVSGDKVLLLYPSGPDLIVALFACFYADVVPIPSCPPDSETIDHFLTIAEDCQPDLILCEKSVLNGLDEFEAKSRVRTFAEMERNRKLKALYDLPWIPSDLISSNGMLRKRKNEVYSTNPLALIQYTPGTTGNPVAVKITHRSLYLHAVEFSNTFNLSSASHLVSCLAPYHGMGFVEGITAPVYSGIPVTLIAPSLFNKKPFLWLRELSRLRGNGTVVSGGPDSAYELCLQKVKDEQLEELSLYHWKVAYTGGEVIRPETLDRFINKFSVCGFSPKAFVPVYGLTEGAFPVAAGKAGKGVTVGFFSKTLYGNKLAVAIPEGYECVKLISNGPVTNGHMLLIADPQSGQKLEEGAVGEILIADTRKALNLYTDSSRLPSSISYNGTRFFKTGDLGFIKNGEVYVTGRLEDLVELNGNYHYLHSIEYTVSNCNAAFRKGCCAAFTVTKDQKNFLVVVLEVSRDGLHKLNSDQELEKIRSEVLQQFDIEPSVICLTSPNSLPKSASGRAQRCAVKAQFKENSLKIVARWQPIDTVKEFNKKVKYQPITSYQVVWSEGGKKGGALNFGKAMV